MLNDRSSPLSLLETRRSGEAARHGRPRLRRATRWSGSSTSPRACPTMANCRRGASSPSPTTSATLWRRCCIARSKQRIRTHCPRITRKRNSSRTTRARWWSLVSAPIQDHKIPVWEQQLSCGAAGMNLLLAAHALGYVGGWVTGWQAYSEQVRAAFCGPGERIAGFIFIGHPGEELERAAAPVARRSFASLAATPSAS